MDDRGRQRAFRAPFLDDGSVGPAEPVFADRELQSRDLDISRDGRLLAYTGTYSGKADVFVTPLPAARELVAEGATSPRFSRDGRELFFVKGVLDERGEPKGLFMSTSISTDPVLKIGSPVFVDSSPELGQVFPGFPLEVPKLT